MSAADDRTRALDESVSAVVLGCERADDRTVDLPLLKLLKTATRSLASAARARGYEAVSPAVGGRRASIAARRSASSSRRTPRWQCASSGQ